MGTGLPVPVTPTRAGTPARAAGECAGTPATEPDRISTDLAGRRLVAAGPTLDVNMLRFGANMLRIGENVASPPGEMIERPRSAIACASAL